MNTDKKENLFRLRREKPVVNRHFRISGFSTAARRLETICVYP
jgi:hypothetical protein